MASPFIPSSFIYGDIPGGGALAVIQVATTAPTVSQNQQGPGTFWLNAEPAGNGNLYYLAGFVAGVPQWELIGTASGSIVGVNGTANQITVTTTAGVATVSLPAAITTPGSLTTTTSLAAGTTVTGGTGLIATTGNVTASGVGSGLLLTPTVVAAGASPQVVNGRVGQVTFSGVSIASGATQTFVITNSAITGSGTVILYSWFGATAGSALSMSSVTNSAGSSSIVMTNGTSATMVTDVANITFVFEVLN